MSNTRTTTGTVFFPDILLKHILSFIPLRDREQTRKALLYTSKKAFANATSNLYALNSKEVLTAIHNLAGLYERTRVAVVIYGETDANKLGHYQFALSQPMREFVLFEALEFQPYTVVNDAGQSQTVPARRDKRQREFNDVVIAFPTTVEDARKICRDYFRIGEFAPGEQRLPPPDFYTPQAQAKILFQTNLVLVALASDDLALNFDGVINETQAALPPDQHIHSVYLNKEIYPEHTKNKYGDELLRYVLYSVALKERGHTPLSSDVKKRLARPLHNQSYTREKFSILLDRFEVFCESHFSVKLNINNSQLDWQRILKAPWAYFNAALGLLNLLEWSHSLEHYRAEECLHFTKWALAQNNYLYLFKFYNEYSFIYMQSSSVKEKIDAILSSSVCKAVLHIRKYKPMYDKSADDYFKFLAYMQTLPHANDLTNIAKDHSAAIISNKLFIESCYTDPFKINFLTQDIQQLELELNLLRAANDFYLATHQPAAGKAGVELWDKIAPLLKYLSNEFDFRIDRDKNKTDSNNKRAAILLLLVSSTELMHNPLSLAHAESLNKNIARVEREFSFNKNKRMWELLSLVLNSIIALTAFILIAILTIYIVSFSLFAPTSEFEKLMAATELASLGFLFAAVTVIPPLFPEGDKTTTVPDTEKRSELKVAVDACKELSKSKATLFAAVENKAAHPISSHPRASSLPCRASFANTNT